MKFSKNTIRSALLITLGLTMVLMGIAWAMAPAPTATQADPAAIAAPIAQAAGMRTTTGTTGLPISNEAPGVADADTEVVETEVTEEVDSPTEPGKKIKRKRRVKRRIKRRGKRGGMKFPKRKKSKGAAPLGMQRGKHPSQMTPQERLQRRNQLVRAQQQRALMRIQRQPTSNLAKLRARQIQQLPPGAKKYGSRKTIGMTPGKSRGKKGSQRKGKGKPAAQSAQAQTTSDAAEQGDSSTETPASTDDGSAEPAPES